MIKREDKTGTIGQVLVLNLKFGNKLLKSYPVTVRFLIFNVNCKPVYLFLARVNVPTLAYNKEYIEDMLELLTLMYSGIILSRQIVTKYKVNRDLNMV